MRVEDVARGIELFEESHGRRPSSLQEIVDAEILSEFDLLIPNGENEMIEFRDSFGDGDAILLETSQVRINGGKSVRLMDDLSIEIVDGSGRVIER